MKSIWILAEAEPTDGIVRGGDDASDAVQETITKSDGTTEPIDDEQEKTPMPWTNFVLMGVIFLVMYMIMFRGPKKKQQKHSQMVKSLSKNDRIRTIGGIFGTVIEAKETELIIKIDESNNTKMRIATGAVAEVLTNKQD